MTELISNVASNLTENYSERISNTIETFIVTRSSGILKKIADFTGIPAHFIITGITACFMILLLFTSGPFFILNILLALYPAYQSFKCLEAKDKDKVFEWMKFWVVFAIFHGVENIGDRMVWWLPGYGILKFVFLIWCFVPVKHNGSNFIYGYLHTILTHNAETLDKLSQKVQDAYHKIL